MKKKSYMVAVTKNITLAATCYREVVAESATEAVELAKRDELEDPIEVKAWEREIEMALEDTSASEILKTKSVFKSVGPASQYHHSSECQICSRLEKENRE